MKPASPAHSLSGLAPREPWLCPPGSLTPLPGSEALGHSRAAGLSCLLSAQLELLVSANVHLPTHSPGPGLLTLIILWNAELSCTHTLRLGEGQQCPVPAPTQFIPSAPASAEGSWLGSFLCSPP